MDNGERWSSLPGSLSESLVVLGVPVMVSALAMAVRGEPGAPRVFTETSVLGLLAFEVAYGALVVLYLRRRGWRLQQVSLAWEWKDLLRGGGVWLLGYLVWIAGWLLAWAAFPVHGESLAGLQLSSRVGLPTAALASLINPIFEEGLWLAYVTQGPGRGRPLLAAALSVGVRSLVHAYQGWAALYGIAPLGVWYLRYYRRTGRLAPVLLAHGLQDLLAFVLLLLAPAG